MPSPERTAIQDPFLTYAEQAGWTYLSSEQSRQLRQDDSFPILKETCISQLRILNPFLSDELALEVIGRICRISPTLEGNLIMWEYLKGKKTIYVADQKQERNIRLINTDDPESNLFHITDEYRFVSENKAIRLDIVLFINGIPLLFVETKTAKKKDAIETALEDVITYHQKAPDLLSILQVFALTHLIKFYYSATWNTSTKTLLNWKTESKAATYQEMVSAFCQKKPVVDLLTEYILFTRKDDELTKNILRPHQMSGVELVVDRAADPTKKHGLIWHTQGSGKTYTMITAARMILENPLFDNPTVIMLVDRNELETQLFGNLESTGMKQAEVARTKDHLKDLLLSDYRGLIVSMIHKFDHIQADINIRDNIIILIDEAHRTTGGDLGNYLMGALPNATYIGFTGTPIDKTQHGRSTFLTFGKDDPPHGYLHKYDVGESIGDGTTVPLHYTLAPNEMRVDKDTLQTEFFALAATEGISDIGALNKVLDKAVNLKNMMKTGDRINRIAVFVANHYREVVEPLGYKAFLVAVDREACALYKKALDKILPPEYSEVVYSPGGKNDSDTLTEWYITNEEEKRIRKAFRDSASLPKILIVTEKLLTGYDAPILYCMYLDKPMRDHTLLQTIARVNRPYEDQTGRKKPCGFILDFVGIFDRLEEALAYDSKDIEGILKDIEQLKIYFAQLIEEGRDQYLNPLQGGYADSRVEKILAFFQSKDLQDQFLVFWQELADVYDIISPDKFLRPYMTDMAKLTEIKLYIDSLRSEELNIDSKFSKKVAALVQKHTQSGDISPPLKICEINEDTLRIIDDENATPGEKVFNLIRSVRKKVQDEKGQMPALIPIGEKAEELIKRYIKRQEDTEKALDELKKLIDEIVRMYQEMADKSMNPDIFSFFWLFRMNNLPHPEEKANSMKDLLDHNPHWKTSETQEREVRKFLYKLIITKESKDIKSLTTLVNRILETVRQAEL
jgi:type I restriction enzyme R subunit